jgi:hypothetical protein
MSRTRRPRLQWLSRAARRKRSLSRQLNLSRQKLRRHPRHLRQGKRDHGRRAVVAAAEVGVEVALGRQLLHPRPQSPENLPRLEHRR